jgi:hypothetical protein
LQCRHRSTSRGTQNLLTDDRREELYCTLVGRRPDALDPAALDHAVDDLAHGRPLHAQSSGQLRGLNARMLPNGVQGAMHADRGIGHQFQFAIQMPHPINEGARCQKHPTLQFSAR